MATARQIEANRRNATGPHQMSEPGKQAIRGNAIRHGLATRIHVVLPGEDQSFYDEILESLQTEYAPATPHEEMLVHQITENYWRLIRARNMESGSLKLSLENVSKEFGLRGVDADDLSRGAKLALALAKQQNLFAQVNRYETTAERSYYRAIRELRTAQRNRQPEPAASPAPEIRSVPQSEPAPSQAPPPAGEIRSVPQYTLADIEHASLTMSPEELDAFMDRITAPPSRTTCAQAMANSRLAG